MRISFCFVFEKAKIKITFYKRVSLPLSILKNYKSIMIIDERISRQSYMLDAAKQIMTAARTAPKGKGIDILEIITITEREIEILSQEMKKLSEETSLKFLMRDSFSRCLDTYRNKRTKTGSKLRVLRLSHMCGKTTKHTMCH